MVKIEAPAYGAISLTGGDVFGGERKGAAKKFTVPLALLSLGCLAMVLTHGYAAKVGTVELEERPKMSIITTEDGRHVAVPPLQVNLKAGTTASYHSEFERNAADKAMRTTQLAQKVGAAAAAKRTKFGLSAKAAQGDVEAYFKREASAAARKQSPPKMIAFSGKAARKEEQSYFKQQAMLASQKQHPSLKQVKSAHRAAEKPPKHGESAAAADGDIDSYFNAQAAAAARTRVAPKVHMDAAPALHDDKKELHGVSAKAARSQLSGYFHSQSAKAAARRTAHKPLKEEPAPKGKAPKFGESAAAAQANINKYFGKEQKAARATAKTVRAQRLHSEEESDQVDEDEKIRRLKQEQDGADDDDEPAGEEEGEEEEEEEPKADAAELEHPTAQVDHIGDVPVDATLDRPMWNRDDGTLPDVKVPVENADCSDDQDCQSSRSPLLYKARKMTKLSAYGVGPEEDNAHDLNKAVNVDNKDEPVITANEPPSEDTINEVNEAIDSQRGDYYTNGNGNPAEKVEMPAVAPAAK